MGQLLNKYKEFVDQNLNKTFVVELWIIDRKVSYKVMIGCRTHMYKEMIIYSEK